MAGFIPARFSSGKDLVCLDFRRLPTCDDETVIGDPDLLSRWQGWLLEILAEDEKATEVAPSPLRAGSWPKSAACRWNYCYLPDPGAANYSKHRFPVDPFSGEHAHQIVHSANGTAVYRRDDVTFL
jgi:hypothetical protein